MVKKGRFFGGEVGLGVGGQKFFCDPAHTSVREELVFVYRVSANEIFFAVLPIPPVPKVTFEGQKGVDMAFESKSGRYGLNW